MKIIRVAIQEIRLFWRCYQEVLKEERKRQISPPLSKKELKALLASLHSDRRMAKHYYESAKDRLFITFLFDHRDDAEELVGQVISRAAWKIANGQISDPVKYLVETVGKELLLEKPPTPPPMGRLSHAPGWGLRRFADLCFSKKTFTQVLEPALSDMQKEHIEALAEGDLWKARMVLVRGYWSFWSAVVAQLPISLARRVYEVWKATKTGS